MFEDKLIQKEQNLSKKYIFVKLHPNVKALNIREQASRNSAVVGVINDHSKVIKVFLNKSTDYFYAISWPKKGFIMKEFVQVIDPTNSHN